MGRAVAFVVAVLLATFAFLAAPTSPVLAASCASGNVPGDITTNTTLSGDLYVTSNVFVYNNATLTLAPGTTVRVCGNYQIRVGSFSTGDSGGLVAVGTAAQPITFDAATAGSRWGQLQLYYNLVPGSRLQHVNIANGGSNASRGALDLEQVRSTSPAVSIDYVTVNGSGSYGIRVDLDTANSNPPTLTNLTVTGSAKQPLYLDAEAVRGLSGTNTFTGNTKGSILVTGGTLATSQTWRRQSIPYEIEGHLYVYGTGSPVLTIEPGTALTLQSNVLFRIGNYPTGESGGLVAVGTPAQPITFGAATSGQKWGKLQFYYNVVSSSQLQYVTVADAGTDASRGALDLEAIRGSAPTIDNVTVSGSGSYGIRFDLDTANSSVPSLANLTITGAAKQPLYLDAEAVRGLGTGNTLTGNGTGRILVTGGTLDQTQTWRRQSLPYELEGHVYVYGTASPVLTLEAGTGLLLHPNVLFRIGNYPAGESGGLVAVGTAAQPITFGAAVLGSRWGKLQFYYNVVAGSRLQYASVADAGTDVSRGALDLEAIRGSAPAIDNVAVTGSGSYGIRVDLDAGNTTGPPLANLTVSGSAKQPINMDAEAVDGLGTGNSFGSNAPNRVLVTGGTLSQSQTWRKHGVPYELEGHLYVYGTAAPVLTIEPGTSLVVHPNTFLRIGSHSLGESGGLIAEGSAAEPITFDEAVGGAGWSKLQFYYRIAPSSSLRHVSLLNGGTDLSRGALTVEGVGSLRAANLTVRFSRGSAAYANSGSLLVEDSVFEGNAKGIVLAGAEGTFRRNTFRGNAQGAILNTDSGVCVDAVGNFWGDAGGPGDASGTTDSCNSTATNAGLGDPIGNGVLYRPWVTGLTGTQTGQHFSSIAPNPYWLVADNATAATLTVKLRDGQGRGVAGKQIALETTRGTIEQPTALTDADGVTTAKIRSSQPGAATISAHNVTDGTALTAIAYVTFATASTNTFGLIDLSGAPYETPELIVEGKPFQQGRPMVFKLPLRNGNPYPVKVDVTYGVSGLNIGMSFTPVYTASKELQPGESWEALGFWTPDVTGHHCIEVKVQVTPLGAGARAAAASGGAGGGGFSGQQNTDIKPPRDKPDDCDDKQKDWDRLAKASLKRTAAPKEEQKAFRGLMKWTMDKWCKATGALNGDPPTHDYDRIVTVTTRTPPAVAATGSMTAAQAKAVNDLAQAAARLEGLTSAALTTADRLAGAAEAGSATNVGNQLAAYKGFMRQAAGAMNDHVTAIDAFLAATEGAGIPDEDITPQDVAAGQDALRTGGFDAETLAYFRAGGYTDAEIEALRQKLLVPDPSLPVTSQYRMLRSMRSLYSQAASRLSARFPAASARQAADGPSTISSDPIKVDIQVRNPESTAKTVKLLVRPIDLPIEWSATVDNAAVALDAGASTTVQLTIYPTGAAVEESQFRVAVEGYIDGNYIGGVLTKVAVPKYMAAALAYRTSVPMVNRAVELTR